MTNDDPMNLFQQVQKMQADMQAAQDALAAEIIEAAVGGGLVKATVSGDGTLRTISIDPSVVDPNDVAMLEDLITVAVADAQQRAAQQQQAQMGRLTGGLDLPFQLPF